MRSAFELRDSCLALERNNLCYKSTFWFPYTACTPDSTDRRYSVRRSGWLCTRAMLQLRRQLLTSHTAIEVLYQRLRARWELWNDIVHDCAPVATTLPLRVHRIVRTALLPTKNFSFPFTASRPNASPMWRIENGVRSV